MLLFAQTLLFCCGPLPARGRLPAAGATGTRVPWGHKIVRSLQAATPLGVDRPDAASANSTGPLLGGRRRTRHVRGTVAPLPHRTSRPRWSAGPYGSSGRRAAGSFESRDTLHRPDDARKNSLLSASARSTLGVIPGRVFAI